jgi:hypothetical protein
MLNKSVLLLNRTDKNNYLGFEVKWRTDYMTFFKNIFLFFIKIS